MRSSDRPQKDRSMGLKQFRSSSCPVGVCVCASAIERGYLDTSCSFEEKERWRRRKMWICGQRKKILYYETQAQGQVRKGNTRTLA